MLIREFVEKFAREHKEVVLQYHFTDEDVSLTDEVLFLEGEEQLEAGIYLCDRSEFLHIQRDDLNDVLFICYKKQDNDDAVFSLGDKYNYISVNLTINKTYNLITKELKTQKQEDTINTKTTAFFDTILSESTHASIHEEMRSLPSPLGNTNFLLVCRSDSNYLGKKHEFMSRLTQLAPGHNVGEYEGCIVAIVSQNMEPLIMPFFDHNGKLLAIMEEYDVFATVSTSFFYMENMPIVYKMTRKALDIRMQIPSIHSKKARISSPQDYIPFLMADFCHDYCEHNLNLDAFAYMLHPGMVKLVRYDKEHDSDLSQLLFSYLKNDRNITQTAAEVFMHKNTIINKIKKINSIIDCNLDDPKERLILMMSQLFIAYSTHCCQIDMLEKE